jgi:hypothetical protein
MNAAETTRQTALGMLVELYFSQGHDSPYLWESCDNRLATSDEVAANIVKLRQLGRTARWQGAISRWADMVDRPENDNDPRSLRWAFLQGLVYASHASQ